MNERVIPRDYGMSKSFGRRTIVIKILRNPWLSKKQFIELIHIRQLAEPLVISDWSDQ